LRGQGFDEDAFGQTFADAQAGVADLANNVGMTAKQFDFPVFAQAHFTEARADFRRSGELFDADDGAGFDPAEGANKRAGTWTLQNNMRWRSFAHDAAK
jgi:hypothetical protein